MGQPYHGPPEYTVEQSTSVLPTKGQIARLDSPALASLLDAANAALADLQADYQGRTSRPNGKPRKLAGDKLAAAEALAADILAHQECVARILAEQAHRGTAPGLIATTVTDLSAVQAEQDAIAAWEREQAGPAAPAAPEAPATAQDDTREAVAEAARLAALAAAADAVREADGYSPLDNVGQPAPDVDVPAKAPRAPKAPTLAGQAVRLGRYPTLAEADVCATCTLPISSSAPWELPDGSRHHKPCAANPAAHVPAAAPAARPEAPGSLLPVGGPAGAPMCFGCKLAWRADATPVVATNGQPYHHLCAEWAHMLPRVARGTRPAAPAAPKLDARTAALAERMAGLTDAQFAALLAALPAAPEATATPEAPASPEAAPEAPAA